MSFQRAYINCLLCYNRTSKQKKSNNDVDYDGLPDDEELDKISNRRICKCYDDKAFSARNRAMIALENIASEYKIFINVRDGEGVENFTFTKLNDNLKIKDEMLSSCAKCDYSSPNIVNLIEKYGLV